MTAYMRCPRCGVLWKSKMLKGRLTRPNCQCGAVGLVQPKPKQPLPARKEETDAAHR